MTNLLVAELVAVEELATTLATSTSGCMLGTSTTVTISWLVCSVAGLVTGGYFQL